MQWTNDPPNPKVRSWNVTELRVRPHRCSEHCFAPSHARGTDSQQIDPTKRHIDKSTVADFWRTLEAWIAVNKPWLSY